MSDNLITKCLSHGMRFKFDDESGTFEGYASVFNGEDSYGDTVLKGAYEKTLQDRERPVRMRWNHYGEVVGKWLEMREDDKGLYVKGQLTPGHSRAEDIKALLKHGAIDGLSIGYYVRDYERKDNGGLTLKEVDLVEISIVEEPADLGASVTNIKSKLEKCESLAEIEQSLRDSGFTRSAATMLVSRIKALAQSDSEEEVKVAKADATIQRLLSKY